MLSYNVRKINAPEWRNLSIRINSGGTLLRKALDLYPSDESKKLYELWKKNQIQIVKLAKSLDAEDKINLPRKDIISKLEKQ